MFTITTNTPCHPSEDESTSKLTTTDVHFELPNGSTEAVVLSDLGGKHFHNDLTFGEQNQGFRSENGE